MKKINMRNVYEAAIGIHATPVTMANAVNDLTLDNRDLFTYTGAGIGALQTLDTFFGLAEMNRNNRIISSPVCNKNGARQKSFMKGRGCPNIYKRLR